MSCGEPLLLPFPGAYAGPKRCAADRWGSPARGGEERVDGRPGRNGGLGAQARDRKGGGGICEAHGSTQVHPFAQRDRKRNMESIPRGGSVENGASDAA